MKLDSLKRLLLWLCLSLSAPMLAAADMPGAEEVLIASSLHAASPTPAANGTTTLAIKMTPQGEWHGYWKQPGDVGLAPRLTWHLPDGVSVGEVAYPLPQTLQIDGIMNHVYGQPYALLAELSVAEGMALGTQLPIRLDMQYLACRHDACVPERASLQITLHVGHGEADAALAANFTKWRQALPRPLGSPVSFTVDKQRLRLEVPLPASIEIDEPHLFSATKQAIVDAAPQRFERRGDLLIVETRAGASPAEAFEATLALGNGLGLDLDARLAAAPARGESGTTALLLALAGAIAGGLLLNLMPCVFPILSLKAMSLARAGASARAARREALAYTAGVMATCMLLGGVLLAMRAGGAQLGWAFQLQDPRMILLLLLLTCVIAFNMAGLFELSTLDAGAGLTRRSSVAGAFWTGALAAFVATPCTGPFMAAALGTALILPPLAGMLVFAGLGFGIALPFLLLGFVPALQRRMPKPGLWMATLRRLLAVPMFLTMLALSWVLGQQVSANALTASLGCAMLLTFGLWLTGLRQRGMKPQAWLPAVLAAALVIPLGLSQMSERATQSQPANRLAFDPAKLEVLRAGDKPVFLYFTADWCMTCKVNEQIAIDRRATEQAFAEAGVEVMRGDWTQGDPGITAFLAQHGRSGVPLYLWYTPGQREPRVLPQVLGPDSLIDEARATP
ncbi:protein-disulfide reductase DsbD family protein [Aeromonas lusitana]|uniref:Thiol:disulfide interchange protein n=1 Tax=Aeromonas lusitana TaxID=931529 RepID=A0A2M8H6M4_9GAMM|nr:protein-disulfide reductase DsbD domain-containing protein [Aeromonas lusitana]PJC92224.1 thiol:disulfide interchange protein [Aeromonas lusitana]